MNEYINQSINQNDRERASLVLTVHSASKERSVRYCPSSPYRMTDM